MVETEILLRENVPVNHRTAAGGMRKAKMNPDPEGTVSCDRAITREEREQLQATKNDRSETL